MHAHICLYLWDPMDCSPPGSSAHGISQARILECVAMPSRESSQPRIKPASPAWAGGFYTIAPLGKTLYVYVSLYIYLSMCVCVSLYIYTYLCVCVCVCV